MKYVLSILIFLFLNIEAVFAQEKHSEEDEIPKAVLQSIVLDFAKKLKR